ncbi:MAG: hypothetical protein ACYSUC_03075 [Planctomycetota bacterium]
MTRSLAVAPLVVLMCFFAGCASYWYQEEKTFEECKQDRRQCFEELKKYSSNWRDMGDYEFKFMEDCMTQKGYRPVKEKELPLKAKREDPDQLLHWRLRGVAGIVDEQ